MPDSNLHVLHVGPHGTFGRSDEHETTPAQLAKWEKLVGAKKPRGIVLYFHGGLVPKERGMEIASAMSKLLCKDRIQPVGIVWDTGFIQSSKRALKEVFEGPLGRKLLMLALRRVSKYWRTGPGGRGPGVELRPEEIEAELAKPDPFSSWEPAKGQTKGAAGVANEAELQSIVGDIEEEALQDISDDNAILALAAKDDQLAGPQTMGTKGLLSLLGIAKFITGVTIRCLQRGLRRRDHGFYVTVVEEVLRGWKMDAIGAAVWGVMRTTATQMWLEPGEDDGKPRVGAGLLAALGRMQGQRPGLTVDLVGHSAGSIAICSFLEAAATHHPELKVRNVVLMAPACTAKLLRESAIDKPERFAALRVFVLSDERERADRMVPGIYPRSLLYFVSGLLESEADEPLAGLMRHIAATPPFEQGHTKAIANYLTADRLVVSGMPGGPGLRCDSRTHGGFDDDADMLASLCHITGVPP